MTITPLDERLAVYYDEDIDGVVFHMRCGTRHVKAFVTPLMLERSRCPAEMVRMIVTQMRRRIDADIHGEV